jgi:hypothetical protein
LNKRRESQNKGLKDMCVKMYKIQYIPFGYISKVASTKPFYDIDLVNRWIKDHPRVKIVGIVEA